MKHSPVGAILALVTLASSCTNRGPSEEGTSAAHPMNTISGVASNLPQNPSVSVSLAGSAQERAAGLSWGRCDDPALSEGDCATLAVPLDYQDSDGTTIDLALYRVRAHTTRIGTLIVNPGGPGATGIDYLQSAADLFPPGFDVISFDPRGVSRSHPVECVSEADLDSSYNSPTVPRDDAELSIRLAQSTDTALRCLSTALASSIGTTDVARDIDRLRSALGDEQINYFGFSYGARLGWTYATMFPDRVRAMVLDGPEDPTADMAQSILQQAAAYEQLLGEFGEYCAALQSARCPSDPRAAITEVIRHADVEPIPTEPGMPPLSGTYALNAVITAFYDERVWPELGDALRAAVDGDGTPLLELSFYWADRANPRPFVWIDAQTLIYCSDRVERPTRAEFDRLQERVATVSRTFGEWIPGRVPYCYGYPPSSDPTPSVGSVDAPAILVVSSTGDVATPLAGAQHLVDALGNARLLIREGPGHTSYGQNLCIDQYVDRYLIDLDLPDPSTTCTK